MNENYIVYTDPDNNINVSIILQKEDDKENLIIKILEKENSNQKSSIYISNFSLPKLSSKNSYFLMYQSIDQAYKGIMKYLNLKRFKLAKKDKNNYILTLILSIDCEDAEVPLIIMKEKKEEEAQENIGLNERINALEKQNLELFSMLTEAGKKFNERIKKEHENFESLEARLNKDLEEKKNLQKKIEELNLRINELEKILYPKNQQQESPQEKTLTKSEDRDITKSKIITQNDIDLIQKWLPQYKLKNGKLIYSAKEQGDSTSDFHKYCDGKSPTLTLILTDKGKIMGGYTKGKWASPQILDYIGDSTAFAFNLSNKEKYEINDERFAINGKNDYGPSFGWTPMIQICDKCFTNQSHVSFSFTSYKYPKEKNGTSEYFKVIEIEIYQLF